MKQLCKNEMKKIVGGKLDYGTCSVSCNSGYYACCNGNGLLDATCVCKQNGTDNSCDDGGQNSSSCSVGDN
jgi:hypothetical protein